MRAVRLTKLCSPLEDAEIERPSVGASDVLIRIKGAGICHSDSHYRAGVSPVSSLPMTLGHEVAGVVEEVGEEVKQFTKGDRVCVHYLVTCGHCPFCQAGTEQFCAQAQMIGKHRDGGYAEFIAVPERSVFRLPEEIPFEQGAILMCSSATSLHALKKARLQPGETIAIFGLGGLGISALQLAKHFGAAKVFAVDINPRKLEVAERFGAIPVNGSSGDPVREIQRLNGNRGVDVALELVGLPLTMRQAVQSLGTLGRAALVGVMRETFEIAPYVDVVNKEAEIIGVSDHVSSDIPLLFNLLRDEKLTFFDGMIRCIPLEAAAINEALEGLETFGDDLRTVITG